MDDLERKKKKKALLFTFSGFPNEIFKFVLTKSSFPIYNIYVYKYIYI